MAAIMISVAGINCENLSCNKRGVHIWGEGVYYPNYFIMCLSEFIHENKSLSYIMLISLLSFFEHLI